MDFLASALVGGALTLSGIVVSTSSVNQDDWTGFGNVFRASWQGTASIVATGIADGTEGKMLLLSNDSGNQVLGLADNNTNSAPANRFNFGKSGHQFLFPGEQILLQYWASRWQILYFAGLDRAAGFVQYLMQRVGATTAPATLGISHTSMGGTIATPNIASTNYRTSQSRHTGATGTTAGTGSGTRDTLNRVWRGNSPNLGGFYYRCRWGLEVLAAGSSSFVGLGPNSTPGNANATTFINCAGFQYDPAGTQWQVGSNDGTGTANRISLGTDYPIDTTAYFEGHLWASPNSSSIAWAISRLDNLAILPQCGVLTTKLPIQSTFIANRIWTSNRSDAAAQTIAWSLIDLGIP